MQRYIYCYLICLLPVNQAQPPVKRDPIVHICKCGQSVPLWAVNNTADNKDESRANTPAMFV